MPGRRAIARRHPRVPYRTRALIVHDGGAGPAETVDVGVGGALLVIDQWVPPNSEIAMLFKGSGRLSAGLPPLLGMVRWARRDGVGIGGRTRYRVGVAFMDLPPAARWRLRELAF